MNQELDLGCKFPEEGEIEILDLWHCDMGKVLNHVYIKVDPHRTVFGFLPLMATTSKGSIGALTAVFALNMLNRFVFGSHLSVIFLT